ncbi:predicted protein [Naegleria gruberi]|uniref:Predicted protein n=1 Tax=Naegleria gruberi TaxID=5762 RepID=D2VE61_NAEGR|nr:uncharacterized protein NAEGRDRAFT_67165 [Naegleria gruberi]EFC44740.1 predicted protein [Naegleria gruberi]|eukprot:XP_002677484.1 predicted protein [Naegleria gruberi strain NEG-M]
MGGGSSGEVAIMMEESEMLKERDQEGLERYCRIVSNTCGDYPLACWSGRLPFFTSIDESVHNTNHWDDLFNQYYSTQHVFETCQDELKLSTLKRKRRVKEPSLSATHEEPIDNEEQDELVQLNEEDSFSGRNIKKTKRLHACSSLSEQKEE